MALLRAAFCLIAALLSLGAPAAAQVAAVPPPSFAACRTAWPPIMPERWRATGLMMPFLEGQIDVGEFVYDGTLPAMRATVYGLESGAADLLITAQQSYLLTGPSHEPTGCLSLGPRFKPPSSQWLSTQAVCVGEAKLAAVPVQWWKMPGVDGQVTWHWLKTDNGLPWRSMFVSRAADPAIVGDYAMTYFSSFAAVAETNLAGLKKFCGSHAKPAAVAPAAQTVRDLMSIPNAAGESERATRIAALIPGLSETACSRMKPVRWPEHFVATAMIAPISFSDNPYAGLIYYDWADSASQFAILWQGLSPSFRGLVALRKGIGYQPGRMASGAFQCRAIYPGMVRPNWAETAQCRCKGVIESKTALSPDEATHIFACPIKGQDRRIMWNWYTESGRPLLFAEAAARGVGAMLADYYEWRPGHKVPASDFVLPKECTPDNIPADSDVSNPSCSDCHTTR